MAKVYTQLPPDRDKKILGIFTTDKRFYRTFFPLLLVIGLQQLAAITVNLVDNVMLGNYTELALSGVTLVNQIQFTLQQIASGIGMGIIVLASRYWGRREIEPIKQIISVGVKFGLAVGIVFCAVSLCAPHALLSLLTNDQEVIAEAVKYLRIVCWTYLLFSVSNSLMYSLQSVQTAMVGTIMSVSTIIINICLNYCLIFGNLGAPELGIAGAAAATLVSRAVELIIVLIYILFIDKKLKMRFRELVRPDFIYLRDFLKVASPLALMGLLWGIAQAAQTAVLGHISAEVIAASSIANVIYRVLAVFGLACANAASVTISKTIGEGRLDMVRSYSKTLQGIFLLIGLIVGGLIFSLKGVILNAYAISDETRELAIRFLTILSITSIGSCYEYPVECGIIAGGGSTKFAPCSDNFFMWLFTIPAACLSAFVFKFSPVVTYAFLKADQILKCIPNGIACNRYRWVKKVMRSEESNGSEI